MQSRRHGLVLLVAVLAIAATGCGSGAEKGTAHGSDVATPSSDSSSPKSSTSGTADCTYTPDGQAAKPVDPPSGAPLSGTQKLTMRTSQGTLHLSLDADATPCTVTSFASLAHQGYYDDTSCHRLTTSGIFVLQCGDPTGTGGGGPGYSFPDELTGSESYPAGTLAMANAGPDTNGSQFFFVYADTPLPPAYTVFGSVDGPSLKTLKKVARAGSDNSNQQGDGAPNKPVKILSVG